VPWRKTLPTELSRSLLTVLIPGAIGVAPWVLALLQHTSATLGLNEYPTVGYVLLFCVAAVAGTVFQGLGSFAEVRWDRERESEYSVKENWFAYLSRTFPGEPVGYRYVSRMATALHFDLAMLLAGPLFVLGSTLLACLRFSELRAALGSVGVALLLLSVLYFRWSARCTHKLLCETRIELNRRLAAEPAKS